MKIPEKTFQIQKGMMQVCYALLPCVAASVYLFGWRSLSVLAVALSVGIAVEALFTFREGKPVTSAVFVTAMIFGVLIGTYSSIYIAAPVLIYFKLRMGAVTGGETETAGATGKA